MRQRPDRGALRLAVAAMGLFVAGCGGSEFAYYDEGGGLTLSLLREQDYLGGPWRTTFVPAATALCQKRYPLDGLSGDAVDLKVFRAEPGVFILNSGKAWYVTELKGCAFQTYRTPPPYPGDLIGRFAVQGGKLSFVSEKKPKR